MVRILWGTLLAIVLARAAASLLPGTWAWGLASLRDVPPAAWVLWALCALALVPPAGRLAARPMTSLGNAWTARGAGGYAAVTWLALGCGAAVLLLGDRGYFVGDFVMRLGIVRKGVSYASMFPQALPLDVLLHERFVTWLSSRTGLDPLAIERPIGALRAAALACCGVALARALDRRGAAAVAIALAATVTGALALSTGYAKGLADLCLVASAVSVLVVRVARGKGGLAALGVVVAIGIGLHRSGFLLLAPWAVAVAISYRKGRLDLTKARDCLSLTPPLIVAALVLPAALKLLAGFDRPHLFTGGAGGPGPLAMAFEVVHLGDAANAIVLIAPLALPAAALAIARPHAIARRPEAPVLAASVVPWLLLVLLVHPRQGMVRDWDVFAPAGAAIACAAAALLGEALAAVPARRWLAPALALAAVAPVGSLMLRAHDADRSLAFAQHVLDGPPVRGVAERASLYQYRSITLARNGRLTESALEARRAAELVPSPTQISIWLTAATLARDQSMVRDALSMLVARQPTPARLILLARVEISLGHLPAARQDANRAFAMAPNDTAFAAWAHSLGPVSSVAARAPSTPPWEER